MSVCCSRCQREPFKSTDHDGWEFVTVRKADEPERLGIVCPGCVTAGEEDTIKARSTGEVA